MTSSCCDFEGAFNAGLVLHEYNYVPINELLTDVLNHKNPGHSFYGDLLSIISSIHILVIINN